MASGVKDSGYAQLTTAECQAIAIRTLRRDFLAQSAAKQAETLARVKRLLEAERRRAQNVPSYLAQHAKEIYGL